MSVDWSSLFNKRTYVVVDGKTIKRVTGCKIRKNLCRRCGKTFMCDNSCGIIMLISKTQMYNCTCYRCTRECMKANEVTNTLFFLKMLRCNLIPKGYKQHLKQKYMLYRLSENM